LIYVPKVPVGNAGMVSLLLIAILVLAVMKPF